MVGLRQCSFSGSVPAPTRPGGCAAANIRRRLHAQEEEEPRELVQGGSRQAGGLDRWWPLPGAPIDPCAHPLEKADEGEEAPGQAWPDTKIADALQVSRSTVARVRQRCVAEG